MPSLRRPMEKQLNRRPHSTALPSLPLLLFPPLAGAMGAALLTNCTLLFYFSFFFLHLRGQSHQRIFLQSYPFNSLRRRVPHGHSRTNVVAPFRDIATDDDDDEAAQSLGGACAGGSNPEERARVSWRRRRRRWRWWGKRFFPDDLPTCAKGDFDLGGCISPTCAKAR